MKEVFLSRREFLAMPLGLLGGKEDKDSQQDVMLADHEKRIAANEEMDETIVTGVKKLAEIFIKNDNILDARTLNLHERVGVLEGELPEEKPQTPYQEPTPTIPV